MSDLNAGDVYRLRALGVLIDSRPKDSSKDELLAASLQALMVVSRERREAEEAAARWRRRFWLCAAAAVSELAVIALLKGGWL